MNKLLILLLIACTTGLQAQPDLIPYRKGDRWGFSDKQKKIIIAPQYEETNFFTLIYGKIVSKTKHKGKYGLIDEQGKQVLPFKYGGIESLAPGLIKAKVKGKWKLMHHKKRMKSRRYDEISLIGSNHLKVKAKQKIGLLNLDGKKLIPTKFDSIKPSNLPKFYLVYSQGKTGVYNLAKRTLSLPTIYDKVVVYSASQFIITQNLKTGVCNVNNKVKVPLKYDKVIPEKKCYLVVINKKQGLTNGQGKEVLPTKYDRIERVGDHQFQVDLNGKRGIFNESGKQVKPFKTFEASGANDLGEIEISLDVDYDDNRYYELVPHQHNGKWGFVTGHAKLIDGKLKFNRRMKIIIKHKYDKAEGFDNDLQLAKVVYKGKQGYINKKGVEYFED